MSWLEVRGFSSFWDSSLGSFRFVEASLLSSSFMDLLANFFLCLLGVVVRFCYLLGFWVIFYRIRTVFMKFSQEKSSPLRNEVFFENKTSVKDHAQCSNSRSLFCSTFWNVEPFSWGNDLTKNKNNLIGLTHQISCFV